jgi:hypothetical protein
MQSLSTALTATSCKLSQVYVMHNLLASTALSVGPYCALFSTIQLGCKQCAAYSAVALYRTGKPDHIEVELLVLDS